MRGWETENMLGIVIQHCLMYLTLGINKCHVPCLLSNTDAMNNARGDGERMSKLES